MMGRYHQTLLQAVVPGLLLHELCHWLAARVVAADARLCVTDSARVRCATAWQPPVATWRRVVVGLAPMAVGVVAGVLVAATVGLVPPAASGLAAAAYLWLWLSVVLLALPSGSDLRLAFTDLPGDTHE